MDEIKNSGNEKYWELSKEEEKLIKTTCGGTIPTQEALYWILPEIRSVISCINKGTLTKSEILPGMKKYNKEIIERYKLN